MIFQPDQSHLTIRRLRPRGCAAALFVAALLCSPRAFAVNKDMVQLQTQIQQLQDAVARLQQSNDERMGVMKDLIQQSADSINKMAVTVDALHRQLQTQQEAQGTKVDQVSGQIQSLNDSLDELKARMSRLEKLTQDIQNQQQSLSANVQNIQQSGGALPAAAPPASSQFQQPLAPLPAPAGKKGKPSAAVPANNDLPPTPPTQDAAAPPPADE